MTHVVLICPGRPDPYKMEESLSMGYIAAALRAAGSEVEIIDRLVSGGEIDYLVDKISSRCHNVLLGFTVMCRDWAEDMAAIAGGILKKGAKPRHITAGGTFINLFPEKMLRDYPFLDSVVLYEGERTIKHLWDTVSEGKELRVIRGIAFREGSSIIINPNVEPTMDLDSIAIPSRDTLTEVIRKGGPANIQSSRGCYGTCTYCAHHLHNQRFTGNIWRARSAQAVVDEIEYLIENYSFDTLVFIDENFLYPGEEGRDRAYGIASEIIRRKLRLFYSISCRANDVDESLFHCLRQSGLRGVLLGLESASEKTLELFKKGINIDINRKAINLIRSLNISLAFGFIMFHPYITLEEVSANFQFLREEVLGLRVPQGGMITRALTHVSFYEGTEFYDKAMREGFLREVEGIRREDELTFHYVDRRVEACHLAFYMSSRPIEKLFLSLEKKIKWYMSAWKYLFRLDQKVLDDGEAIVEYILKHNIEDVSGMMDFIRHLFDENNLLARKILLEYGIESQNPRKGSDDARELL